MKRIEWAKEGKMNKKGKKELGMGLKIVTMVPNRFKLIEIVEREPKHVQKEHKAS